MRSYTIWLATSTALSTLACTFLGSDSDGDFDPGSLSCSIPSSQIFNGGPGRDGIPSLQRPAVTPADEAGFSNATRVLGVVVNGEARAYPYSIMWWHEVANDRLGDEEIVVTYCPLTGSGIGFSASVDGTLRSFGVSGLLYENNLIMFDRQTESLWNQLLLGAQCGPSQGAELSRLSVFETNLGRWRELYPQSTVVSTSTGFNLSYGVYPYGDYDQEDNEFVPWPGSEFSAVRPPKELVLGVHANGASVAFPFGVLRDMGAVVAINDAVGGLPILVTYERAFKTARAFDRRVDGQNLTFSVTDTATYLYADAETGSTWNARGEALSGPLQGQQLAAVADAYTLFWFAWSVYYPDTRLVQ
jgi:hypothetical protein